MISLVQKINSLYNTDSENQLVSKIESIVGIENYRPKLDTLSKLLASDVDEIEQSEVDIIVVGGTNGKGGVVHNLRSALAKKGKKVALWTSPHVLSICERMVVNNNPISYQQLDNLVEKYREIATEQNLSFYEFLFFLFIKYVKDLELDYIVLEVGLGGTYDAVNIFNKPLCAICSISRDHTNILGNSLVGILKEKYGITRKDGKLISGVEQDHLKRKLLSWTKRDGIELVTVDDSDDFVHKNKAIAKAILEQLNIEVGDDSFDAALSKGRREKMTFLERDFIFIGAHNLDGHRKMLKNLLLQGRNNKDDVLLLSFSTGREDQIPAIISLYEKGYPCLFAQKYLCEFNSPRAVKFHELPEGVRENHSHLNDWNEIFNDQYKNKNIYIAGSYFFISEFQRFILSQ
jgi:dihydrofolate synthase/folylpolyglutamate synthase